MTDDHAQSENPPELLRLFLRMKEITGGGRFEVDLNDPTNAELRDITDSIEKYALHANDLEAIMLNGKVMLTVTGTNYDNEPAVGSMVIPTDVFAGVVDGLMPGFIENVMGHVEMQVQHLIKMQEQQQTEGDN